MSDDDVIVSVPAQKVRREDREVTVTAKPCRGSLCKGKTRPASAFNRDSYAGDGLQRACRECRKADHRDRKAKVLDHPRREATHKLCNGCGETKERDEFSPSTAIPDGLAARCHKCNAKWDGQWRADNRDEYNARARARYRADPDRHNEIVRQSRARRKAARVAQAASPTFGSA